MKNCIFGLAAATAAITAPLSQASNVEPVIVTATRTAQTADQSLAAVTIITREQIDKSPAQTVEELLTSQTGIDITVNGGYGQASSLFMRGTGSRHTLILIDGLKMGSASSGKTALELLPLDQVERIEIVRGPRSSLYGSEAIGGVIQIFTHEGGKDFRTVFQTGVGSNKLRRDSISNSGSLGNTRYSISLASLETEGFDAVKPTPGPWGVDQPDDDGYTNYSGSLRIQHRFDNGLEADMHLTNGQGNVEYDSSGNDSTDYVQQASGVAFSLPVNDIWFTQLTLGETRDKSDYLNDGVYSGSTFNTKRTQLNWQNDLALSDDKLLTLGLDYLDDKLDTTSNYVKTSRDNAGVFAQYQSSLGEHNYTIALRKDDNEAFGTETTGNIAWGYAINTALRLNASYGTAFVAPSFNDLYYPPSAFYVGNPDLKPEKSATSEIGIVGDHNWGHWRANVFSTEVEDLIVYDASVSPATMNNLDKAQIDGIELEMATTLLGWNASAQATLLTPEDKKTNKQLPRRAKNNLTIDVNHQSNNAQIGIKVFAQSMRYDDAANTTPIRGYGTTTIYGNLSLNKHWHLRYSVSNIADKAYETVSNYNTAGRTVFIGIRYDTL